MLGRLSRAVMRVMADTAADAAEDLLFEMVQNPTAGELVSSPWQTLQPILTGATGYLTGRHVRPGA